MIEGAVHHLDFVADFAGARCQTLYASTWKPSWAEYAGDTDGIVVMTFENGARGIYEGSSSAAVGMNDWYHEYVRVECEEEQPFSATAKSRCSSARSWCASAAAKARGKRSN